MPKRITRKSERNVSNNGRRDARHSIGFLERDADHVFGLKLLVSVPNRRARAARAKNRGCFRNYAIFPRIRVDRPRFTYYKLNGAYEREKLMDASNKRLERQATTKQRQRTVNY